MAFDKAVLSFGHALLLQDVEMYLACMAWFGMYR